MLALVTQPGRSGTTRVAEVPELRALDGEVPVRVLEVGVCGTDLFGSVNAHRQDWLAAVEALDRARVQWPDALEALVGLRVPLDRFGEAFGYRGVKATLVLADH